MIAQRHQRGWSQDELAAKMLYSGSTVSNIESCYRAPTPAQARRADEVFGTHGTFQRHERNLRDIPFSAGFRPFTPHEEQAHLIRLFEHSLMPGLFQIGDYARTLTKKYPETTEETVQERVNARLQRQAILFRETPAPPRVHALLDEQVLHRNVGGPEIMVRQMEHLAKLAQLPRITLQVIPEDEPHAGLLGAFVIADTGQAPSIIYKDGVLDGQVVESAYAAEEIDVVFRALQADALTASASLAKIEESIQRWKDQIAP
jgi:transcriptional regulator with XRE-family HTH domain